MLYKRGKVYYIKLKHRGKVIRKSSGATNKRAAERFQERLRAQLKRQRQQTGYTFGDAAVRWIEEKLHKKSIHTDKLILDWLLPRLEQTYLSEINADTIRAIRQEKRSQASESTVNRNMALLRSILNKAIEWEWIDKAPKVPMYPKRQTEPRFLTWQQWLSLEKELPSHLKGPAWFAVLTGLRAGAIRSLRWDWISRDGISFPPEVMKNGQRLTIPLSVDAVQIIALFGCDDGSKGNSIFVTPAGSQWHDKFKTRAWDKACERAGVPGTRFHDLRHTWASWQIQRGVPPHIVQELGGWKSAEAMRIYARFSTESLAKWV